MQLTGIDWAIMAVYFTLSLLVGMAVARRSGQNFQSFFLAGRSMPWWLLGISMVATTFSTDTPNLVTDIVRSNGTFGNWTWWAFLLTGLLTVFLYAKLWRRSGVLTDVEFYELRYSGRMAAFLRGFRAAYLGILFNVLIMASVTLAAIKIGSVMLGWSPLRTVTVAATVTMIYSAAGGLRGVVLTDLVQFGLAMVGSIGAAYYVLGLPQVGGLDGLLANQDVQAAMDFLPDFAEMSWGEILPVFLIPLAVQWWASYYPGSEPGGGGYVAQRMLSARSEREAAGATLLFNALHYALRPWPWILVALASLVVFPDLASISAQFPNVPENVVRNDLAYPAMLTFLPAGLLGIVVTSLAAAYMSTMSTQVNWGSSIIVNDIYHRFFNREATEKQQVWVGRVSTVVLMVMACALALLLENSLQVFTIILQIGAGTGLLFILRWFWWRINAETELAAMIVSFLVAVYFQFVNDHGLEAWAQLTLGVGITTAAWMVVALVTPSTAKDTLIAFYEKIRPGGPGWQPIAREASLQTGESADTDLAASLFAVLAGSAAIYGVLFTTGFVLYGRIGPAVFSALVSLGGVLLLKHLWPRLSFS
ncbi:MAG: Na+:solute symporter [Rhodothermales bacterium]|nr:Na+:solute symporter [Rhodothermales bacterium]MBO6780632.1 Na+:solute symporter [Rhodothermales bacterium]